MDPSVTFTPQEKRFVLAEIIKTSRLDVDLLARFIATNEAQPQLEQWMMMQIPQGRNLAQCMQIAEQLATQTHLKRKWANDYTAEGSSKRPTMASSYEVGQSSSPHGHLAPLAPGPVTILPRPSNGHGPSSHPSSPPPAPAPKKRGRPSRADKAKRDLRPLLPQRATPRNSDHAFNDQRPILPAPLPVHDPGSRSSAPILRDSVPSVATLRQGFPVVDVTRPRVLSDGAVERTQAYLKSELTPLEPQVRDSLPRHTPPHSSPTILAPLLHQKSPTTSAGTPPGQAARPVAPVINSA